MDKYSSIDKNENNADNDTEQDVDKIDHEFFNVGAYFSKDRQCLTAALIFKLLIRQFHRMLESVGENFGAEFLDDNLQEIVLEILGDPADHRYCDGCNQQPDHAVQYT